MTDRDQFAAAALTGMLAQGDDGSFSEESYARSAYRWADAMLRVRNSQTANTPVTEPIPSDTSGIGSVTPDGMEDIIVSLQRVPDRLAKEARDEIIRLRLTNEERAAIERASVAYELLPSEGAQQISATLRGLLDRLSQ